MSESGNYRAFREAVQVNHAGATRRITVDGRTISLGEFDPNHQDVEAVHKKQLLEVLHGPETTSQETVGVRSDMVYHARQHMMNGTSGDFLADAPADSTWSEKLKEQPLPPQAELEPAV